MENTTGKNKNTDNNIFWFATLGFSNLQIGGENTTDACWYLEASQDFSEFSEEEDT